MASKSVSPTRSTKRPSKVMAGWCSTSRKSAERRWSSRVGSPVHSLVASMRPVNLVSRQWSKSQSMAPRMSLNRPRTQVTIMCRARNSASVCPGSNIQVAIDLLSW